MSAFDHTPTAWLYGYVQTLTPGYRKVSIAGTTYTVGATDGAGVVWPTFISSLNSAISGASWTATTLSTGAVVLTSLGAAAAIVFPDRLGGLLGMVAQPGAAMGTHTSLTSSVVPYAGIPLYGATWAQVDVSRSVEYQSDRMGRQRGYVYGGARLWTWDLCMSKEALTALQTGWCLRTKIKILGAGTGGTGTVANPISSSNPIGELSGYPMGIQSISWRDDTQTIADVRLLVSGGAV